MDDADMREVLLYRDGLVTAAASVPVATSGAFLPEGIAVGDAVWLFYAARARGLTPPSARSSPSLSSPTSSSRASPTRFAGRSRTWSAPEGSSLAPSPSTASPQTATSPGSRGTRASTPSTPRSRRPSAASSPRSPRSRMT
ncbi:uncharacterized protein [Aegilops tauschii subsp. strangulata]|uniref:uncharacterized protein n=1 Tax=Aegilops tauschii subsp. strangulata TaxID=200361 RepID=UPI00098B1A26